MPAFKTTIAQSATGTGVLVNEAPTTASSYTLDTGAFLRSTTNQAIVLDGPAAWTVTINGHSSGLVSALYLQSTGAPAKVTIGEDGSLTSVTRGAFFSDRDAAVTNKGSIVSLAYDALEFYGAGTNSLTNSGLIAGGSSVAMTFFNSLKTTVTNTGTIYGILNFTGGTNKVVNSGVISISSQYNVSSTYVAFSSGDDTLDNKGTIDGYIELGAGKNTVTNSGKITGEFSGSTILGGANIDTVTNSTTGVLSGGVALGAAFTTVVGTNTFTNAGSVGSNLAQQSYEGGGDGDKITNSGTFAGGVWAKDGINTLVNSKTIGEDLLGFSYRGGNDADTVTNSKGAMSGIVALGNGANKLTNSGTIGTADDVMAGNTVVTGGDAIDTVTNSGTIFGDIELLGGNDVFTNSGEVKGEIRLGEGNDVFTGGKFVDTVYDDLGLDTYKFSSGDDIFFAFDGAELDVDTLDGSSGIDTYNASLEDGSVLVNMDSIDHVGADWILNTTSLGKSAASDLNGAGRDTLKGFENVIGSDFDDIIFGSSSANVLAGGLGQDELFGLAGNDVLDGGISNDRIDGGLGADKLRGGTEGDRFVFSSIKDSGLTVATRDVIEDFALGNDFLDLSLIDADTRSTSPADQTFDTIITAGGFTVGQAGDLRIYQTATGWIIEGEVTGDAKADFSIAVNDLDHSITWGLGTNIIG